MGGRTETRGYTKGRGEDRQQIGNDLSRSKLVKNNREGKEGREGKEEVTRCRETRQYGR